MKFAVEAHLLIDSNVVFVDKTHTINHELQSFSDVSIYLSEKDITDLYNRMLKAKRGKQK